MSSFIKSLKEPSYDNHATAPPIHAAESVQHNDECKAAEDMPGCTADDAVHVCQNNERKSMGELAAQMLADADSLKKTNDEVRQQQKRISEGILELRCALIALGAIDIMISDAIDATQD
ncbi:MAG: hypothetical protein SGARI_001382, partial [Bacillariaceae sp.]